MLFFSFSPVFLFIFRTRGSVRIRWRPEMRRRPDMTESPSTGSGGGSLPSFCPDGLPVYREILCPHNTVIQSVHNLHVYRSIYSNSTAGWGRAPPKPYV